MLLDQDRVPASFDEAMNLLNLAFTDEERNACSRMSATRMFALQARLAAKLRDEWSLEDSNTPLCIFFRELGLEDADDISLLLIDAFWRLHNKQSIAVHDLVEEYLET
jgi:hypothetical protein